MTVELGLGVFTVVAAACLVSGFAHGALGFGFPIVATPIVAAVIDIKSAIAILAPITLVITVISAVRGAPLATIAREFWFLLLATLGTRAWLAIGVLALPAVAALGMRLRERIDAPTYRRWLRGALWVLAALLLAQFSTRVLGSGEARWRAIEEDDEKTATALVRRGAADLKARNAAGDTPLHRAVEKGLRELAESLLARGVTGSQNWGQVLQSHI